MVRRGEGGEGGRVVSAITRRTALVLGGAAALLPGLSFAVRAGGGRHALSVFGEPAFGPDFAHFDYVDPDAPKGGEMRLLPSSFGGNQNPVTFNTFNTFILKGDSPPLMDLCHAPLMVRNLDEPDAVYAYLAEAVEVDGKRYAFHLKPGATFTDGSPITAEDVVWSFETLKTRAHPVFRQPLAGVARVEAAGPATAVVTFADDTSNRLPPLVAGYPVLSKAYYEANEFEAATLDIPVTSGPYTVGDFRQGRYVNFVRRDGFWGDDVPAGRGQNNFGTIRVDFFRERTASFEAFKTGAVTFREEFTSKTWATEYDFPAVRDGRVVMREFPDERPAGAQGFFINTRRKKFADKRTREALTWAFDFEWTNENLFYGLYERTVSFFMNSDMMATGEPSPEERALLEPYRDQVDPAVFGPAWLPPVTDGSGRDRAPLQRASQLLREAGWRREGDALVNAEGETLAIEFLYGSPTFERIIQPYANRLRLLGINATLRLVDGSQYQDRVQNFDFDLTTSRFALGATPGESIRLYWASETADDPGSLNLAGIADPVVDALTKKLINAPTREEMVTAARALDRVLRLGHYWVPQWYKGVHTVAYWADEFGIPEKKPRYGLPVATTWWSKDA